jgi:hypothetical protein
MQQGLRALEFTLGFASMNSMFLSMDPANDFKTTQEVKEAPVPVPVNALKEDAEVVEVALETVVKTSPNTWRTNSYHGTVITTVETGSQKFNLRRDQIELKSFDLITPNGALVRVLTVSLREVIRDLPTNYGIFKLLHKKKCTKLSLNASQSVMKASEVSLISSEELMLWFRFVSSNLIFWFMHRVRRIEFIAVRYLYAIRKGQRHRIIQFSWLNPSRRQYRMGIRSELIRQQFINLILCLLKSNRIDYLNLRLCRLKSNRIQFINLPL